MAIAASCPLGHALSVDDAHSGHPVRCPVCHEVFVAPAPVLHFVLSEPPITVPLAEPAAKPLAPAPADVPSPEEATALDEFPAVVFDGQVFAAAASYAEFCEGIAVGEPQAIEIALADYSKERVALAGFYRTGHGESIEVMRRIQQALLGCPACGKTMSDAFGQKLAADQAAKAPHSSRCEHCGSPRAYLLVVPDLIETTPESGNDAPVSDIPEFLKRRKEERRKIEQEAYRKVQWGVTCHLARQAMQVSLILAILTASLATRSNALMAFLEAFIVAAILSRGLGILGSSLCCSVPEKTFARPWITAALWLDVLSIACALVSGIVLLRSPHLRDFCFWLEIGSMVLGFGAWAMFMYFLAHIGKYLKFLRAADRAAKMVPRGLWLVIVAIIAVPIVREMEPASAIATQIAAFVLFLGLMAWFVGACWFVYASISICNTFRQLIGEEVERRDVKVGIQAAGLGVPRPRGLTDHNRYA